MAASNKKENCFRTNTFYKSASRGLIFAGCEQPGLGKGVPFFFGDETKGTVLGKRES